MPVIYNYASDNEYKLGACRGSSDYYMQQAAAKPPQAAAATWKLNSKIKQQHFVANYGKLEPSSGAITCMQQLQLQPLAAGRN